MRNVRSMLFLFAPSTLLAIACSSSSSHDGGVPCATQFTTRDAGQPATITIDPGAVVNTFVPKVMFGINSGSWVTQRDLQATRPKVQAAGNCFVRFPGGSRSDDYHWNGTGSYSSSTTP